MNILFFTRLFHPHIGGVEKHILTLSQLLIKQGHTVTILTESLPDRLTEPQETYKNMTIYRMPYWKEGRLKKLHTWKWIFKNQEILQKAEIIHVHDVFYWYLPFRIFYQQKPVYITFHGYEAYPLPKNAKLMHKIAENLSWGNICIGDFISKWYETKPTYVSYGAVELPKRIQIAEESHSAIFIGRLDEQTGITEYAQAIRLIKKRFPKFKFTVIGDGPLKKALPAQTNFQGFKNNPEHFLDENHFAFVSRYLAILEAMAHKRLVFAIYDNPLKEDYLRLAPFAKNIIITNSPEEIARKVSYYLNHPKEEKELIENNYSWVKEQTWEALLEQYVKLWEITKI